MSPIGSEEAKIYHRGLRWLPVVGLLLHRSPHPWELQAL